MGKFDFSSHVTSLVLLITFLSDPRMFAQNFFLYCSLVINSNPNFIFYSTSIFNTKTMKKSHFFTEDCPLSGLRNLVRAKKFLDMDHSRSEGLFFQFWILARLRRPDVLTTIDVSDGPVVQNRNIATGETS